MDRASDYETENMSSNLIKRDILINGYKYNLTFNYENSEVFTYIIVGVRIN